MADEGRSQQLPSGRTAVSVLEHQVGTVSPEPAVFLGGPLLPSTEAKLPFDETAVCTSLGRTPLPVCGRILPARDGEPRPAGGAARGGRSGPCRAKMPSTVPRGPPLGVPKGLSSCG